MGPASSRVNADLWHRFTLLATECQSLELEKVESHASVDHVVPLGLRASAFFLGNALADELAKETAKEFQVDHGTAATLEWISGLGTSIARRAALVLEAAIAADPQPAPRPRQAAKKPVPLWRESLKFSEHQIPTGKKIKDQKSLTCTVCHGSCSTFNKAELVDWIQSPCRPLHAATELPSLKRSKIHPSHRASVFEFSLDTSVHFCKTCGNIGIEEFRALAKPCPKHAKTQGLENLSKISRGLVPGRSALAARLNAPLVQHNPRHFTKGKNKRPR